ncbi:LLM class flavin-dependent oxidoreductase [Microbacterium sp. SLBN-146]|uniref:LLM class flavin-dependent oxidoreductase n=1 Tax=Microbacterium sp. SLBN-146 TaxID=2768457 RepID=UPI0011517ED2|nr:LLM class flavin-dependent oxidoreductase [Microbacterium sp. SLBN-146]TQJ31118.1 alkanesulfonate monooxygenase SsuD/methylene tetrahydromethanopterin reductase-like flavin-dependent oxidoreductase (luciferase family) [Microbacterium sp. SLBN-146]
MSGAPSAPSPGAAPLSMPAVYPRWSDVETRLRIARDAGVSQVWFDQQIGQRDLLTVATFALGLDPHWSVGTAVVPIRERHPSVLARAALTISEIFDGRFVLGVGASHSLVNGTLLGYDHTPTVDLMREAVTPLADALAHGSTHADSGIARGTFAHDAPFAPVPLHMGAMRPRMLRLAVEIAQGAIVYLASPAYVRDIVMPFVLDACEEFGRDPASFPVTVVVPCYSGPDIARHTERFQSYAASYAEVPVYGRLIAAQARGEDTGAFGAREIGAIGSRELVRERLAEYRELGCTPVPGVMDADIAAFESTVEALYG